MKKLFIFYLIFATSTSCTMRRRLRPQSQEWQQRCLQENIQKVIDRTADQHFYIIDDTLLATTNLTKSCHVHIWNLETSTAIKKINTQQPVHDMWGDGVSTMLYIRLVDGKKLYFDPAINVVGIRKSIEL